MVKITLLDTITFQQQVPSVFDKEYICECQCHRFDDKYFRFMGCQCCNMASVKYINDDDSIDWEHYLAYIGDKCIEIIQNKNHFFWNRFEYDKDIILAKINDILQQVKLYFI